MRADRAAALLQSDRVARRAAHLLDEVAHEAAQLDVRQAQGEQFMTQAGLGEEILGHLLGLAGVVLDRVDEAPLHLVELPRGLLGEELGRGADEGQRRADLVRQDVPRGRPVLSGGAQALVVQAGQAQEAALARRDAAGRGEREAQGDQKRGSPGAGHGAIVPPRPGAPAPTGAPRTERSRPH